MDEIYKNPHYTNYGLAWGSYHVKKDEIKRTYREGKIGIEEFKRLILEELFLLKRRARDLTRIIAASIELS